MKKILAMIVLVLVCSTSLADTEWILGIPIENDSADNTEWVLGMPMPRADNAVVSSAAQVIMISN